MDDVLNILASEQASWVFDHNITWEDDVWKADPFDVRQVHETARQRFTDLLDTVVGNAEQAQARILMFQGQSGAGKTHLIRALRALSHGSGKGYFGYSQMTPDVTSYADYYLRRLINSLEKPYLPEVPRENCLIRLSNKLACDASILSSDDIDRLREDEIGDNELAELIIDLADQAVSSPAFSDQNLDINIVRALLYLQRNDPRIDQRIRQYLYGRPLNELSLRSVAALDPNDGEDRAFEIIESLGRIMKTAGNASLIYCIDQVEDLRFYDDPEERFQKAIRDLIQIANRVPSAIILISCLDDFYFQMRDFLPQSFIDRIEKSGAIVLRESRTAAEARQIVGKRLEFISSSQESDQQSVPLEADEIFGKSFFDEISGLSTRRVLEAVETRRRELCNDISDDEAPVREKTGTAKAPDHEKINLVQQDWERFVLDFQAEIPSEEEELIEILSSALLLSCEEGGNTMEVKVDPLPYLDKLVAIDLAVEFDNGNHFESRLFICNRRSQGGGLRRQIENVVNSTGGRTPTILRASDFPPNPRSVTAQALRRYMASGGRRLVIPIYEWERMITIQEFHKLAGSRDGFTDWLHAAQILHDLPSIRHLLRLELTDEATEENIAALQTLMTGTGGAVTSAISSRTVSPEPSAGEDQFTGNVHQLRLVRDSADTFMRDNTEPLEVNNPDQGAVETTDDLAPEEPKLSFLARLLGGGRRKRKGRKSGASANVVKTNNHTASLSDEGSKAEAEEGWTELTDESEVKAGEENTINKCDEAQASPEASGDKDGEQAVLAMWPETGVQPIDVGRMLGTADDVVSFEKNILKRHAAVLGGSGSGKTTLALSVIEQLLLRDIPVVLIDRKGDLSSYANSDIWEEQLEDTADRKELKKRLQEKLDVAVYTPGRVTGRPISITLLPNGIADLPVHEQQQLANVSAAALSDMLHLGNSATHQRQGGILTVGLRQLGERSAREVTLADLIGLLEDDYTELVDETQRMDPSGKLRRDLVAQLDSLRHRNWALFEGGGEPLLMDSLLGHGKYGKPDKTRLSIIYTGFLGDNENILFWVAQFLSEALRFSQRNPNEDLQAVIMFDEADLYIPANSKPATKDPLESLLKRARSAGIGLMLATQSPGDLDYKSRDQITSWFIGKVREDTALKKLKAAFSSETGIDPASALPNQKVGEFHLIQEGVLKPIKGNLSLIKAEQVPFDQIELLASGTLGPKKSRKQLLFDFK